MQKLYCLTFYTQPDGTNRDGFCIGLFRTYEEAKMVEMRYRKNVTGFKDCECDEEITEVPIIGDDAGADYVYRYVGWNENEDFGETDMIESDCYVDYRQAEEAYRKAQITSHRKEWALNHHTIGQCDWQEGFVRCRSEVDDE